MNPLEPRVAGCERRLNILDRLLRALKPQLAKASQAILDQQDPYGQGSGASNVTGVFTTTSTLPTGGSGTATMNTTGATYTISNFTEKTVASGATIAAQTDSEGTWWYTTVDKCSNLS